MLVKYDFSSAFGTIHHKRLMKAFRELNIDNEVINYLSGYLANQQKVQSIFHGKTGYYISDEILMTRGIPQGQIGADVCFTIQQMALKSEPEVDRSIYVDDLNDVISAKDSSEVMALANINEINLYNQSRTIGLKINEDKTTHIPFNIPDEDLVENDLKPVRETILLGLPFNATKTGISVKPASEMIIERLNKKARTMHAVRNYTTDIQLRVKIAKMLIYQCIGEIHLIKAYDSKSEKEFRRIKVKVNDILRATGLSNKTPQLELDKVLGTSLENFATHSIILNGLKHIGGCFANILDRTNKIRLRYANGTYLNKFIHIWNELSSEMRKRIVSMESPNSTKRYLKTLRTLKYDKNIHEKFKWKSYY